MRYTLLFCHDTIFQRIYSLTRPNGYLFIVELRKEIPSRRYVKDTKKLVSPEVMEKKQSFCGQIFTILV